MAYPAPPDEPKESSPNPAVSNQQLLTKLERVNRALRTLGAGNHTLLHASDEQTLLHDMCQVIVETGGYRLASVGYAQHDEQKSIRWMASVGLETAFLETLHYTWGDTELGRTVAATAICTGEPSVARNLLTDPVYAGPAYARMREQAVQEGFASGTAFPLRIDGEVFGALVMAAADPDAFDEEEVRLLGKLAADLAYGIANLRTRIQHREALATIAHLAFYDPLTGLPNRTLLLDLLQKAIQNAEQQHRALALLHLEIGHFHEINKVLGYRAGDQLLQALGQRLARTVKEEELLARVGEAEFALLLPHGGADYAIKVAHRLMTALQEPVEMAGLMLDPRAAIGIALYPDHATDAEALLRRANTAMHEAKPGRRRCALYMGGQEQEFTRRLSLMGDLRRAIAHNELLLYCQPKIHMASRRVYGVEVLVRWQHPVHGMLSTIEFIKLAEQAGLITPLTHWMLNVAFSQRHAWHEAGLELALCINLSAHDLYDPGLVDHLQGLFSTWGIAPELIQLELTESALMEDPDEALKTLTLLKQLGVVLFIDDFGTGYSSLGYLQKLPVNGIKIDQSFVTPMATSHDSAAIVRSIIELGHNLELEVVAEGVESQAVWDCLAALGCDVAQGYLISMPMPAEQFRNWENAWSKMPA
jgi:diguanylate cyclase (GGDEF)-like protein